MKNQRGGWGARGGATKEEEEEESVVVSVVVVVVGFPPLSARRPPAQGLAGAAPTPLSLAPPISVLIKRLDVRV